MMAANNTPDFRTISDFRKDHLEHWPTCSLQVLELCRKAGLVKLGHVALDGTKMKANASKHQAMSYGRMKELEAQLPRFNWTSCCIGPRKWMKRKTGGTSGNGTGMSCPQSCPNRDSRLRLIQIGARPPWKQKPRRRNRPKVRVVNPSGVPADKAQQNFTDPESRIMPAPRRSGLFLQVLQLPGGV